MKFISIINFTLLFFSKIIVYSQEPYLVADINSTIQNSTPKNFIQVGNYFYFTATTSKYGTEIWKSDGTEVGTILLKDINLGMNSSNPVDLFNHNGTLYFFATDSEGYSLWKSDGTEIGTTLIKRFIESDNGDTANFLSIGDNLYFGSRYSQNGYNYYRQLWKTDGTTNGTIRLTNINSANYDSITELTKVGNDLYFRVCIYENSTFQLWKSDGTTTGTIMIKQLQYQLYALTEFKNKIFFSDRINLWCYDNLAAESYIVYTLPDQQKDAFGKLYSTSNYLYFRASVNNFQTKIFVSDGTKIGTQLQNSLNDLRVFDFKALGDELFFLGGTNAIYRLVNNTPIYQTSYINYCVDYFPSNFGIYYVTASSDGLTTSIYYNPTNSSVSNLVKSGFEHKEYYNSAFYNNNFIIDAKFNNDIEPWISDGTSVGTRIIKNVNNSTPSSSPYSLVNHQNSLFFFTINYQRGELWKHNPINFSTDKIATVTTTAQYPYKLTSVNNRLYFGQPITNAHRLWVRDSLNALGINSIKTLNSSIDNFTSFNNKTLFKSGTKLWQTDGTGSNTIQLLPDNINSLGEIYNNNYIFGYQTNGGSRYELYRLEPNNTNPIVIDNIPPSPQYHPSSFIINDNKFFFVIGSDLFYLNSSYNLFSVPNYAGSLFDSGKMMNFGDKIISTHSQYSLYDGVHYTDIKISDKTTQGTTLKRFSVIDPVKANIKNMVFYKNRIYFTVYDSVYGNEIWVTDGTINGTQILKDINIGSNSSNASNFVVANGYLYFVAENSTYGRELWRTNGTSEGTIVYDINTGIYPSNPSELVKIGDKLFFKADNGYSGVEIWGLNLNPCPNSLTINTNSNNSIDKFEADKYIISTATINGNSNIKFDAGNHILLDSGFQVEKGTVFNAYIDGCGNN